MKYICLEYMEANKFESISESERNTFVDGCVAYDNMLRKNDHFAGGHINWKLPLAETRHL